MNNNKQSPRGFVPIVLCAFQETDKFEVTR